MPPEAQQCHAIARILCVATEKILWYQFQSWLAPSAGSHRLHCRVGSGAATYYRYLGDREHLLNYGRKMVASKFDAAVAVQWRTGREIVQRGYFDAELTLAAVLAHTCCHEFGHVVQGSHGWIRHRSVHNREFYRVLDRLHRCGAAQQVCAYIEEQAAVEGLPLSFIEGSTLHSAPERFRPGERVSFEYRGRLVQGEVLRVNRKTVNVKAVPCRLAGDYFRVSPGLLTRCNGDSAR